MNVWHVSEVAHPAAHGKDSSDFSDRRRVSHSMAAGTNRWNQTTSYSIFADTPLALSEVITFNINLFQETKSLQFIG